MSVLIHQIEPHSLAAKKKIQPGDTLVAINGHEIMDVLDYQFYVQDCKLVLDIQTAKGNRSVSIRKSEDEDLGLLFEDYLMDQQHSCHNKCIFCFIDQLPKGLRETLYFKDDDSRLSFLFGNYITLTNLTEHEIERIITMHISPVNISVHTTNPELRCKMMNNRFAGDSLKILQRFADAGLAMNVQLVLCPGYNDGEELTKTMEDLTKYLPSIQSVAAVPVGLTKYREGLTPLSTFSKEQSLDVIERMEKMGDQMLSKIGSRLFYPSDEFFLKAERPIPSAEYFGDFLQLENGVGMSSLFEDQFIKALEDCDEVAKGTKMTFVTGVLAAPLLKKCLEQAKEKFPGIQAEIVPIRNEFFGETITVAGLVTGTDIVNQLKGNCQKCLVIPDCMLRNEGDLFLDSLSVEELEKALQVEVKVISTGGDTFMETLLQ